MVLGGDKKAWTTHRDEQIWIGSSLRSEHGSFLVLETLVSRCRAVGGSMVVGDGWCGGSMVVMGSEQWNERKSDKRFC